MNSIVCIPTNSRRNLHKSSVAGTDWNNWRNPSHFCRWPNDTLKRRRIFEQKGHWKKQKYHQRGTVWFNNNFSNKK